MNLSPEKRYRRFFLGIANEEEQCRIEEEVLTGEVDDFFLQNTEDELIDDYLLGSMTQEERQGFSMSFLSTKERRQRLAFAAGLIEYARKQQAEELSTSWKLAQRSTIRAVLSWKRAALLAATASVLFGVLAGLELMKLRDQTQVALTFHRNQSALQIDKEMTMQTMKRFTLAFAAMTGLGIVPLIGQTPTLQAVPVSAVIDVVSVRTLSDGNTLRQERKMNFYRRADGSTRVEEPNRVVIVDNSSHTVTVLDTVGKVAQVQNAPPAPAKGNTPPTVPSPPQTGVNSSTTPELSSNLDLGVKMIAGYSVRGIQRIITTPANSALGNTSPITKTIQVWRSTDLRLTLLTVITDPLGGTTTSQYENVSTATPPDSSLFTVPTGYKIVSVPRSRIISSQTN